MKRRRDESMDKDYNRSGYMPCGERVSDLKDLKKYKYHICGSLSSKKLNNLYGTYLPEMDFTEESSKDYRTKIVESFDNKILEQIYQGKDDNGCIICSIIIRSIWIAIIGNRLPSYSTSEFDCPLGCLCSEKVDTFMEKLYNGSFQQTHRVNSRHTHKVVSEKSNYDGEFTIDGSEIMEIKSINEITALLRKKKKKCKGVNLILECMSKFMQLFDNKSHIVKKQLKFNYDIKSKEYSIHNRILFCIHCLDLIFEAININQELKVKMVDMWKFCKTLNNYTDSL
jgi:hypothetical protein